MSQWTITLCHELSRRLPAGYAAGGEPACEPTALAGLALAAYDHWQPARQAAEWLAERQARDGSIGVTAERPKPCWPTAWALLLWSALASLAGDHSFRKQILLATEWALRERGQPAPRKGHFGHDSTLVGWSWAANTHSWLEPTALFVLALKAAGHEHHPRTREAVRLIVDRLLPGGGCNYGNTIVLGQELLPHAQPTGLAMLALAGEATEKERIEASMRYLTRELSPTMATASLCYGFMGLSAHGRAPADGKEWLRKASERARGNGDSPYKLALVALAASESNPLRGTTG